MTAQMSALSAIVLLGPLIVSDGMLCSLSFYDSTSLGWSH